MKYNSVDKIPTTEMTCAFLAAALMCGDEFSNEQYTAMAAQHAGGYEWFGFRLGLLEETPTGWRVSARGKKFLAGG